MRDYENSDTSSFNTYRSGNENPRRENAFRTDSGSPSSVNRPGSIPGTADHYQRNPLGNYAQDNRNQGGPSYRNPAYERDQQQDRSQYGQGSYRSQDSGSQDRWPRDSRQQMGNFGNHSQDRDWDAHRSGDRDSYENRGRSQNQSWNRWNDDQQRYDQQDARSYGSRSYQQNPNRYSSDYGHQNPSNQGRGYDENRYQNRRQDQDYDRNNQRDEGFLDRMGNSIRNAWNRFTDEEREDQDRANRYEQRQQNYRSEDNRRNSRRDSDTDGPPYNWGASASEDYRW